ncbi:HlyC/CorC family transporter [bacterium]|nr:MAG: HlyC/CorC family transporter [bacterium]
MSPDIGKLLVSILLILGSAFFVAAEYSIVSARKSRIEGLARKGHRGAKGLLKILADMSPYVASVQIAITMIGIGVGSLTEPFIAHWLQGLVGPYLPKAAQPIVSVLSIVSVTFLVVVFGELVPKYAALKASDRIALLTFRPLSWFTTIFKPLVWLVQAAAGLVLKPFGIELGHGGGEGIPKEELLMLVRSGGAEGVLDKTQAELVTRALRLDTLYARDIMVHRLDVKWLDASLSREATLHRIVECPYSRIPVCRGDVDELIGIVYLHDIVKNLGNDDFSLEALAREVITIPENLSLERIVTTMREQKTQMLVVTDEYGGTSGIVTLEDVVEEVFGELEDGLESERPPIEAGPNGRLTVRAEVRVDEVLDFLGVAYDESDTRTLAQTIVDGLERVPRTGDCVETPLGTLRVENMARGRITRVAIQPHVTTSEPV